jgi:hypothetical protein
MLPYVLLSRYTRKVSNIIVSLVSVYVMHMISVRYSPIVFPPDEYMEALTVPSIRFFRAKIIPALGVSSKFVPTIDSDIAIR